LGRRVETELASSTKLRLHFDYPLAFRPLSQVAGGNGRNVCDVLSVLGVIASGHYVLCRFGEVMPELLFGTVGHDRLEDVWRENRTLQALRAGLPFRLEGACGSCLMKSFCFGSCVADTYYKTGSLWAPFWFCEEAKQQGLFPASRLGTGSGDQNACERVNSARLF
jgi:radical SAM protein with 4Fe4S-binding SPASM domain